MESILMSCEKISIKVVEKLIIQNISLVVNKNQIVGLLGPNGAGKTTTFYIIVGLVKPDQGSIILDKLDVSNLPIYLRGKLGISYLPQEASIFRGMSVEDNLLSIIELIENVTIIRNGENITGDYGTLDTKNNSYKIKSKDQTKVKAIIQDNE